MRAGESRLPGQNGRARAMRLLPSAGAAGVPGEGAFAGPMGRRHLRVRVAKPAEGLAGACRTREEID